MLKKEGKLWGPSGLGANPAVTIHSKMILGKPPILFGVQFSHLSGVNNSYFRKPGKE